MSPQSRSAGVQRRRTSGLAEIAVAALLWGTTGVVAAWLHDHAGAGPVAVSFYRLAIAAIALILAARLWPVAAPAGPRSRATTAGLVVSGIAMASYQVLYFDAVGRIGVGPATVLSLGVAPVLIAVWEAVRGRCRPALRTVLTIGGALVGLVLVMSAAGRSGAAATGGAAAGVLVALAAGAVYAAATVQGGHLGRSVAPRTLAAATMATGALVLAPAGLLGADLSVDMSGGSIAGLVFLGVGTTAVAYALFYAGLRTAPGSAAAVVTLLEPLAAFVLGVLLLSEPLTLAAAAGGVLLLAAIAGLDTEKPAGAG
jgi:DME family drug/metabolite transporter